MQWNGIIQAVHIPIIGIQIGWQNAEDLMGLYPDNSHPTSANPDE